MGLSETLSDGAEMQALSKNRIKIPEVPEDVDRSGRRRSSPVGIRQPGCYTLVESSEIAQAEGSLPIRRQGRRDDGMEVPRL
jgi:hypothetical protein